jgi:hypothetical protein
MGIVIWELMRTITQHKYEMPYAEYGLTYDFQIIVQTAQGLRPSIPDGAPNDLVKVFLACLDAVPAKRPEAREIAQMLEKCEVDYQRDPKGFLANAYKAPKKEENGVHAQGNGTLSPSPSAAPAKAGFTGWGKKDDAAPANAPANAAPNAAVAAEAPRKSAFSGWGKKEEESPAPASKSSESSSKASEASSKAPESSSKPSESSSKASESSSKPSESSAQPDNKFGGWGHLDGSDDESSPTHKDRKQSLTKSGEDAATTPSGGAVKRSAASKGVKSQSNHRK